MKSSSLQWMLCVSALSLLPFSLAAQPLSVPSPPLSEALPALPPVPASSAGGVGDATAVQQQGQVADNLVVPVVATVSPAGEVTPIGPEKKDFSYGSSNVSILFSPAQIEEMKTAIRKFETEGTGPVTIAVPVIETPVFEAPIEITEPDIYPSFYLSSIIYDSPRDWSLWLAGEKITSHKNDTDVEVVAVSRDSASFRWRPDFSDAMARRQKYQQLADSDAVKNKIARKQNLSFSEDDGVMVFTLKQNQTFSSAYLKIFEGYIKSPKMDAFVASAADVSASASTGFGGVPLASSPVPSPSQPPAAPVMPPSFHQ